MLLWYYKPELQDKLEEALHPRQKKKKSALAKLSFHGLLCGKKVFLDKHFQKLTK